MRGWRWAGSGHGGVPFGDLTPFRSFPPHLRAGLMNGVAEATHARFACWTAEAGVPTFCFPDFSKFLGGCDGG